MPCVALSILQYSCLAYPMLCIVLLSVPNTLYCSVQLCTVSYTTLYNSVQSCTERTLSVCSVALSSTVQGCTEDPGFADD
jgi:hypothetical protein